MTVALIAHDGKKAEMVSFILRNKAYLQELSMISTGTTGNFVESAGFKVEKVLSGPRGGDAQIAAKIAEGLIDAVFFFRDPLDKHPHEPDVQMLMRLCDVHDVPLATNPSAAALMLYSLRKG